MRNLARLMSLLPIVAAGVAWFHAGHAAALPPAGQRVAGEIVLLGKHIPVPPGEWRVISAGFGQVADEGPGPYGAIGGVLLMRPDDPGHAFLLLHTNVLPVHDGWGQPLECIADTALFRSVAEPRDGHNGCSFVAATRIGWLTRARLPALGNDGEARAHLPPWALIAGFRVSDRRDVLDIRYGVVPQADFAVSTWFTGADKLAGPQGALVAGLGAWAQQARATALAALRDPDEQIPPLPSLAGSAAKATTGEDISALRLGLYKLLTYRLPASLFGLAVGWGLSGNFYTGAQVMLWQSLTHSAVFFGNEMAWEWPRAIPLMPFTRDRTMVAAGYDLRSRPLFATAGGGSPLRATLHAAAPMTIVSLDGKLVPLPGEGWVVLADDSADGITGTVLVRVTGNALAGLAVVHTNQRKQSDIFGTSSECARSDITFAAIRYDTPEDGYCLYGKQVIPSHAAAGNPLWGKALDRLEAAGISLPASLMMAGVRVRTRENMLEVRYYFTPAAALANRDRDDTGLAADPVAALQAWVDLMQEPIELGVRGRGPAPEAQSPWPWDAEAVNAAIIDQAHGPLLALAAAGVLDQAALRLQLASADAALAVRERQRWSLWSRSAYKVATYRAASYVDATAVTWLITGSMTQGFRYASISALGYPVMAYVNELGWAGYGIGKPPAALVPVDFPEIGRDLR